MDGVTGEQKWAIRNHAGATETVPWYVTPVDAMGVPMSGAMRWGTMYAEETDVGAYLPGTGTAQDDGMALSHGGGSGYWDMDWSWGSEAVPLEYPGFEVSIEDLGSGNYRVTLTPAEGPVKNITTGTTYGTIQGAINAASAGNVIEVSDGTYDYVSEGMPAPAGLIKINKPLTLRAADDGNAVRPVIDSTGFDGALKIWHSIFTGGEVVIEGFEIVGDGATDIAITAAMQYAADSTAIIVHDNVFHGMNSGIDYWGTSGGKLTKVEFTDNVFYDLGQDGAQGFGIMLEDLSNWVNAGDQFAAIIEGNQFYDIHDGTSDQGVGVVIPRANGDNGEAANVRISNNIFESTVGTGVGLIDGDISEAVIVDNALLSPVGVYVDDAETTNGPANVSPNWWGSITGPAEGQIEGNVAYNPWCGDAGCTFFMPQDGKIVLDGTYNQAGGFEINEPNVTIYLKDGTVIQNDSPCFTVNADNVTIEGEYPGEEVCIPTGTSAGIEVAADVSSLVVKNLDFDGSSTTGSAIDFAGDVDGVQIVNNYFHDFTPSAIVFGGEVLTEHVIQGNMFMNVGIPEIDSGTTALDASFNSWGENAAPTITNVTTSPFTHVDLWMDSSGAFSGDQVAKGETITYTVYADMTKISGAEFMLAYPTSLLTLSGTTDGTEFVGIPDGSGGTKDLLDTTTAGQIKFTGIVPLGDDPVTGTDVVLFTASFTAADPVPDPSTDVMELVEIVQGFSMTPDDPYYTNHVYPAELLDGEVTVIERPTISSDDIDGYYLTGDTQEFNVRTVNPADGGNFDLVLFRYELVANDGDISLFQYYDGASWLDMPMDCVTTPGKCVGYFGPSSGFPFVSPWDLTTTFRVNFVNDGTYTAVFTLEDLDAGDKVLTTFDTMIEAKDPLVYTKPTIASTDIGGPYTAEVEKCFSLTINNVDADMITDGVVVTELSFDYPEGTVISYGGTDYTCTSLGCPLIPVTLTSGSNDLEFCVTFPEEFDDDITVTLLDTDWDPDRELATETFEVKVYANWSVEGKVTMQGRTYRGEVPMTLTGLDILPFGFFTEESLNQMGANIFFSDIAEGYYVVTTNQERYLNVPGAMLVVDKDVLFPDLYLYGGNANTDDIVDISDASIVGAAYGIGDDTYDADVNFDNRVNIQDLALVGGNYQLTDAVYDDWTIPYGIQGQVVTDETGHVTGTLTGSYNITIDGQVSLYVNNVATFSGTVSGDIVGTVDATVNENGTGTMFGTLIENGTLDEYQILGIFPKSGTGGHFVGTIVSGYAPSVTGLTITSEGDATTVVEGGTLQMYAAVTPVDAYDRVIWSVWTNPKDPNRGEATIDPITGLLTGISEGPVTVIAKALDGSLLGDTKQIDVKP